ncbi:glycoside hydrolase family 16 protein [Actinoplanes sp. TRM 88003]|uniref:Glycoside hydrolase family 16 protein n=1 Tax=Paractinoplanes aksuensis TaxID=2939490 RepID=A0ABT1DWT1_9ACTN|nr:glycoside hydrolase family 16 protein [Actinoplanes aksuensis]MCO8275327.1 glycoside hydrolase family 16 protein [Actinoplanes aksuensis]
MTTLDERFESDELDRSVWVPWYLPHWSSRAQSAATYEVGGGELRLSIPVDQPLWAEGVHETPLRVSGIQSANYSGPAGSTVGGQPFLTDQRVREEQGEFWGYTPLYEDIEIRMRGTITPRSMIACWLSGIETAPELSGEICVMEVFGTDPQAIGMGLHRFRDPQLTEEWGTVTRPIDVAAFHTYGVKWRPNSLEFTIDGEVVQRVGQAPDYPVQLEIAVFDFPDRAHLVDGATPVPELVVSHVRGRPAA